MSFPSYNHSFVSLKFSTKSPSITRTSESFGCASNDTSSDDFASIVRPCLTLKFLIDPVSSHFFIIIF